MDKQTRWKNFKKKCITARSSGSLTEIKYKKKKEENICMKENGKHRHLVKYEKIKSELRDDLYKSCDKDDIYKNVYLYII